MTEYDKQDLRALISLIRKMVPSMIVNDIVGVQPMGGPTQQQIKEATVKALQEISDKLRAMGLDADAETLLVIQENLIQTITSPQTLEGPKNWKPLPGMSQNNITGQVFSMGATFHTAAAGGNPGISPFQTITLPQFPSAEDLDDSPV